MRKWIACGVALVVLLVFGHYWTRSFFSYEFKRYPPSDALDDANLPYCGAMKLPEAIMGQDLMGVHSDSAFRRDGMDRTGAIPLYPVNPSQANLSMRRGPYILDDARAFRLVDIYGKGNTGAVDRMGERRYLSGAAGTRGVLCLPYV